MAQKTQVLLIDDVDGGPADETVEFGIDGKSYAVDLSDDNAKKLREALDPFLGVARKVSVGGSRRRRTPAPTATATGVDATAVRAWAKSNGIEVNSRGRIPKEVVQKYVAAGN